LPKGRRVTPRWGSYTQHRQTRNFSEVAYAPKTGGQLTVKRGEKKGGKEKPYRRRSRIGKHLENPTKEIWGSPKEKGKKNVGHQL